MRVVDLRFSIFWFFGSKFPVAVKGCLRLVIILMMGITTFATAEEGWLIDFEMVKKEAADRDVPILADFSGSDWCVWCIRLDNEVFSTPKFKIYAEENLVLFLADFPSRKSQSDAIKKQNKGLAKRYGVRGYPTVLLLDADGEVLARTGYQKGGPSAYIKHIEFLLK